MSLKSNPSKTKIESEKGSQSIYSFLVIYVVVLALVFLLSDTIIEDYLFVNLFKSSVFAQFSFINIPAYFILFISLALAPIVAFIVIASVLAMFAKGRYKISGMFWITLISLVFAITIHFVITYYSFVNHIIENGVMLSRIISLDNETTSIDAFLLAIPLQGYMNGESPVFFFMFYVLERIMQNEAIIGSVFYMYDVWFIFLYYLIIFIPLTIFFHTPCLCENLSKKKVNICSKSEWYAIILIVAIMFLPALNVIQLYTFQSENYVDWNTYYANPINPQYYYSKGNITTEFIDSTMNVSMGENNFTMTAIKGYNHTINDLNGSEVIIERLYPFETSDINFLAFQSFWITSSYDRNDSEFKTGIIEKQFSDFWDHVQFYAYVLNDDNTTGFGYQMTNNQSLDPSDIKNVTFYNNFLQKDLTLPTYSVNISGQFHTTDEYGVLFNITQFMYRMNLPYSLKSITPEAFVAENSLYKPFLAYSFTTVPLENMMGYYDISVKKAKQVGLYVRFSPESDVDFDNDTINETFYFIETNLYCGNVYSPDDIVLRIGIFDAVYLAIAIGLVIILYIVDSRNEELRTNKESCKFRNFEKSPTYKFRDIIIYKKKV